jgi:hypothetical protein
MAKEVHTSFIPKESFAKSPRRKNGSSSFIVFLSGSLLVLATLGLVGSILYLNSLTSEVKGLKKSIDGSREALEPESLKKYQDADARIKAASDILDKHVLLSPIFSSIERLTVVGVSFKSFDYSYNVEGGISEVKMSGEALSFSHVAVQAKSFAEDKSGLITNPLFSNLNILPNGKTVFNLTFSIDPSRLRYANYLPTL